MGIVAKHLMGDLVIHGMGKRKLQALTVSLSALLGMSSTNALSAVAGDKVRSDKLIQKMLKIAPSANLDYFRVLYARSLGLPDTASSAQIQTAYNHSEYLAEARMCGWPLNLSDTEYGVLVENRRNMVLAEYGNPEVGTDKVLQTLLSAREAMMFAPRNLFNSIQEKTPATYCDLINEGVMEYEQAWRMAAAKHAVGLLPWASDKELETLQNEKLRTMLVKGLHLSPSASFEEINIAQGKIGKQEHSQLLHRIFKAPSAVQDAELEKQLKPLVVALGYPILRGTNCAGSRVATADDLLNAAVRPPLAQTTSGLAGAPTW